jgi:hypothetical protein
MPDKKCACAAREPELAKETTPRLWSEAPDVEAGIAAATRLATTTHHDKVLL